MKIIRAKDYKDMSRKAANIISAQVIMKPNCVLGLATGGTPVGAYAQLVEWYNKGDLDFSEVTTVNLDEYRGLPKEHPESYWSFMHKNLFDHVNIRPEAIHLPDGTNLDTAAECARYNGIIHSVGGIDLQLLGLGPNGHIGFNEPNEAVVADAQQLQVNAADTVDDGVIAGALGRSVEVRAIRQVDGLGADVHMVKQGAVHEAPIALGVLLRQAAVLVQVDGRDLGEVDIALVVPLDQLLVGAHGGAAGSQAQHAVGLHDDLGRNDVGGLAGHIVVIFCADDLHKRIPPVFSGRVAPVLLSSLYHAAGGIL